MKHHIATGATKAGKESEVFAHQASAIKKRARVQLKVLNDSLPETRLAPTIPHERKMRCWNKFSKKYIGKKLFVQDN